ncbi:MAG: hypothetical protein ABJB76_06555 [Candidatus Nitrosocosmicus sp.]
MNELFLVTLNVLFFDVLSLNSPSKCIRLFKEVVLQSGTEFERYSSKDVDLNFLIFGNNKNHKKSKIK